MYRIQTIDHVIDKPTSDMVCHPPLADIPLQGHGCRSPSPRESHEAWVESQWHYAYKVSEAIGNQAKANLRRTWATTRLDRGTMASIFLMCQLYGTNGASARMIMAAIRKMQ